ncbi:MAG: hypothetical protein HQL97_05165 [Magnetococcales bacterium]|nr:hypothetical protein [Magnetococcales bacterium]
MNDLTTMEQVAEQIHSMALHHHDRMVDVRALRFHALDRVEIEGVSHPVSPMAQRRLSEWVGVSHAYLHRCEPWLQAQNLNAWLARSKENQVMRIRFQDDRVRAFFSNRYVPTDHHRILAMLFDMGVQPETHVQSLLDDAFLSLSIPDPGQHFSLAGGDAYMPGFNIRNSEIGFSSLQVSAFLLRLACTNGTLLKEEIYSASYPHINQRAIAEIPTALTVATRTARLHGQQNRIEQHQPVQDLDALFHTLNRRFHLTMLEKMALDWGYAHDPGNTLFHVLNAYTKGSQHPELNAYSAIKMQRVGGLIMSNTGRTEVLAAA